MSLKLEIESMAILCRASTFVAGASQFKVVFTQPLVPANWTLMVPVVPLADSDSRNVRRDVMDFVEFMR